MRRRSEKIVDLKGFCPGEQICLSRRWTASRFSDLRFFNGAERGGHFAAMENPHTFVEHLHATFQTMI